MTIRATKVNKIKCEMADLREKRAALAQRYLRDTKLIDDHIIRLDEKMALLSRSKEIYDYEAPNCGAPWSEEAKERLSNDFQEFLYWNAKSYGRSTLAVRFKVAEELAGHFTNVDWNKIYTEGRT